ncbi:MAG: trypsin-like serine protease [Anaerolineae bacterium]|jgi:hypothetical protein
MKKVSVVASMSLVLLLLVIIQPVAAITWGELDVDHTNVGAIVVDWPDYGPFQICSGTLIHERVFLTAGHCTYDLDELGITTVWVNFDQYALNPDTLLLVEEVITHEDYGWGSPDPHDIAALVLAEPVEDIEPATLPEAGFLDDLKREGVLRDRAEGADFVLVGYGGTLEWPPPEIAYDDLRRVAYSEYTSLPGPWLHMSQNVLQDNGGTCFGDSGGPAFWVDDQGNETIVGVTSWGDAQCVATSFNYRVDIPDSIAFIEEVIAGLD